MALTPDEIDGLRELILAVYGPVTEELLRDLCRCIAAAGQISSGDEYKLLLAKSLAGADDVSRTRCAGRRTSPTTRWRS